MPPTRVQVITASGPPQRPSWVVCDLICSQSFKLDVLTNIHMQSKNCLSSERYHPQRPVGSSICTLCHRVSLALSHISSLHQCHDSPHPAPKKGRESFPYLSVCRLPRSTPVRRIPPFRSPTPQQSIEFSWRYLLIS